MKEFGALFVAGYLTSALFLLPLLSLYLCLISKKAALAPIIGFHKAILMLSIALPIAIVLVSYNSGPEIFSPDTQDFGKTAAIETYVAVARNPVVADTPPNRFPALRDVMFYFVDLIAIFSISGLLIFILRYALQAVRLSRIGKDGAVSKIGADCRLVESMRISLPFSVGLFRKRIFIPVDMPALEKDVVTQHELNHFGCRHHFWSLLEALLACVFWFNPIAHILRRRGAFLRELECDRLTIRNVDKYLYTRLLLKTAEAIPGGGPDSRFSLMTQGWARKRELKMRIENLMSRENGRRQTLIGVLLAVAVAVTAGTAVLYGNLSDAKSQRDVLDKISVEYGKRAPETARIEIAKVPRHFIDVLLAHQDYGFYEHNGVSVKSVVRAAGANLKSYLSGGPLFKQGGSTITQQLAKQFTENPNKRTLKRKFEELKIARVLESNFSKDEILEMYLNMIYFGDGTFGLKAASHKYFGHDYMQITPSEASTLVPILNAPDTYAFQKDPGAVERRWGLEIIQENQTSDYAGPVYDPVAPISTTHIVGQTNSGEPIYSGIGDQNQPKPIQMPLPSYTPEAREYKIAGIVVLEMIIDKEGRPRDVKVLQGLGYGLDESAVNTIARQWLFKPGTLDGKPVHVKASAEVSFQLY